MKEADFHRIGSEAARDFANSTGWLDCDRAAHKEQATQALAQVVSAHIKKNFWHLTVPDGLKPKVKPGSDLMM